MTEWPEPEALEEIIRQRGGPGVDIDSSNGKKLQTAFFMLQALRLGEQIEESQKLARSTRWMAFFVAVASLAQILTVVLAFLS